MNKLQLKQDIPIFNLDNSNQDGFMDDDNLLFYVGRTSCLLKTVHVNQYLDGLDEKTVKIWHEQKNNNKVFTIDDIKEYSRVQNIFNFHGLAPRIYDVVELQFKNKKYIAQITDEINGKYCLDKVTLHQFYRTMEMVAEKYQIDLNYDWYLANMVGSNWVDFGGCSFKDVNFYKGMIKEDLTNVARWGGLGSYQQFKELGLLNGRTPERLKNLGLDKIDLGGKTVLELGCSGGAVLNYLNSKNPKRIIGVDTEKIALVAREAANYFCNFNIEFYGYDLKKDSFLEFIRKVTGIQKFDVIIMFSVHQHIGWHEYMGDLAGGEVYIECNAAQPVEHERVLYNLKLKELGFKDITEHGVCPESGKRLLLKAHI